MCIAIEGLFFFIAQSSPNQDAEEQFMRVIHLLIRAIKGLFVNIVCTVTDIMRRCTTSKNTILRSKGDIITINERISMEILHVSGRNVIARLLTNSSFDYEINPRGRKRFVLKSETCVLDQYDKVLIYDDGETYKLTVEKILPDKQVRFRLYSLH